MLDPFSIDKDIIMKRKGFALIPVILIIGALCVGSAAYFISKKNDSLIEQAAETVLMTQGVDIDFSPDDDCPDNGMGECDD